MTYVCTKCGEAKGADEYYVYKKPKPRRYTYCKVCFRRIAMEHHAARYKVNRVMVEERFARGCEVCGITDHRVLEFHHIKPVGSKATRVSEYVYTAGPQKFREELAKCQVLCANHHAIHHYEERQRA